MVRLIRIYRNPETSEGLPDEEFTRLVDAILCDPTPGAEIIENGVTYASAVDGPGAGLGWRITRTGARRLLLEHGKENLQ